MEHLSQNLQKMTTQIYLNIVVNNTLGMYKLDSSNDLGENMQTFVNIDGRILLNISNIEPLSQRLVTQLHLYE